MASSIYAGLSGLEANQTFLDVAGNNLSNVNTTGFKSQSVGFEDIVYQTLDQATLGTGNQLGGTNPTQIGLGTSVATTVANFQQGTLQQTGRADDLAIQGNGFFVVNNGTSNLYTRNGAFDLDTQGFLVDPATGYRVQRFGTVGEGSATAPAFQTPGVQDIKIPFGAGIPAKPTANVTLQGNLDPTTATGATYSTAIQVYDTQGTAHSLTLTFTKTANPNEFSLNASVSGGTVTGVPVPSITFNADGSLNGPATASINIAFPPGLPTAQAVTLNFGTPNQFNGLTQVGGSSTANATAQDGTSAGSLTSFSVAQDGTIQGIFSNGQTKPLAQLALATFSNTDGLSRVGNNYYAATVNSGQPLLATGLSGGKGSIQQGTLEQSNVDVSLELTNLIIAQRGYQANARTITASDQILQALTAIQ